jgi:hypothetical protein
MTRTGSDNPVPLETEESAARPVPRKLIVIGLLALVFAAFVGTQVLGVLVAILLPPAPPTPDNLTEATHSSAAYGVDEWLYESTDPACDALAFYQAQPDTLCSVAPLWCGDNADQTLSGAAVPGQHVARCQGITRFSLFAMRWQAVISTADTPGYQTEFRLAREIFWTGDVPPLAQN